jgi:hypothetical protein
VVRNLNMIPITRNGEVIYVSDPVDTVIEAFQQLASYNPGSAVEVEQVAARQVEMFNEIGRAYSNWATSLTDGQPFEQAFADSIREIGVAVSATSGIAQNAHQTMRAAHAADFKRIEEPRQDEGMWDPGSNR